MSLYRLSVRPVRRSVGHSALALAAYNAGERLRSARHGRTFDFSWRSGIVHREIVGAHGRDRESLWNGAEAYERRSDALLAREVMVALPHELEVEAQVGLARDLAIYLQRTDHVAVDVNVHMPDVGAGADPRNVHAHLLITRRVLDASGFAETLAHWDDNPRRGMRRSDATSRTSLLSLREEWEHIQNRVLVRRGLAPVTAASYADQGLLTLPGVPLGRQLTSLERSGESTQLGAYNREVAFANRVHRVVPEIDPRDLVGSTSDDLITQVWQRTHTRLLEMDYAQSKGRSGASHLPTEVQAEMAAEVREMRGVLEAVRERMTPMVARAVAERMARTRQVGGPEL